MKELIERSIENELQQMKVTPKENFATVKALALAKELGILK